MSKRSRQSTQLKAKPLEEQIPKDETVKKQFNSREKTTIASTSSTKTAKQTQPAQTTLAELKNLKNLRRNQEQILMKIENENIEKHIQQLLQKFDPPYCANCPKRRADRVCLNKACGQEKYMQIICSKCHYDEHQKAIDKSDIDIEEYFIKLSKFVNQQKMVSQRIDLDRLDTIFDELDHFRQSLASLRSKIVSEIESFTSPDENQNILQNSITKALSLCEYDNIQEQLDNIKKRIIFEKNKFIWNDNSQKYLPFLNIFNNLEELKNETSKKISQSFIGDIEIKEIELIVQQSSLNGFGSLQKSTLINKNNEDEVVVNGTSIDTQFYIDYNLKKDKKYKMRFRINCIPSNEIIVGVIQKSLVESSWIYSTPSQNLCKRFFTKTPNQGCCKILKGTDLSKNAWKDSQIEMRIDLQNNYVDFYDYPEVKNINSSLDFNTFSQDECVIAFTFYVNQSIIIESLQELSDLEELDL